MSSESNKPTLTDRVANFISGGKLRQTEQTLQKSQSEAAQLRINVNTIASELMSIKLKRHVIAQPSYVSWKGVPRLNYAGGTEYNYEEARMLACTPTPRMCINRKKLDVMNTAWEIVPLPDENGKITETAKQHAIEVFNWLYFRPNSNSESFRTILGKVSDDLDTHDAAALTKTYGKAGQRRLVEISARDGSMFTKDINLYLNLGVIQDVQVGIETIKQMNVGYWYNWNAEPKVPYEPHEVAYAMDSPRTDIPYGTSPSYTLRTVLFSLMYDHEFYNEIGEAGFKTPSIYSPDLQASSTGVSALNEPTYESLKKIFKTELNDYATRMLTPTKFLSTPIVDMKLLNWLETKEDYQRLCIANYNLTPIALGLTKDVQKSVEQSQMSLYIQRGLWPRLKNIEWIINTQIISEWFWTEEKQRNVFAHGHEGKWAGKPMDVMFRFKLYDPVGEEQQQKLDIERIKAGLTSINAVLKERGKEPLVWGDIAPFFLNNPQQWGQSYAGGAIKPEVFHAITGIEPAIKQIQQAIVPKPQPDNPAASEQTVKAFQLSRAEVAMSKPGNAAKADQLRKEAEQR